MFKAQPTEYAKTLFRSRLEAKWAHYFDLLKWQWVYEPRFSGSQYTPDFGITLPDGSHQIWEIKPAEPHKRYYQQMLPLATFGMPVMAVGSFYRDSLEKRYEIPTAKAYIDLKWVKFNLHKGLLRAVCNHRFDLR